MGKPTLDEPTKLNGKGGFVRIEAGFPQLGIGNVGKRVEDRFILDEVHGAPVVGVGCRKRISAQDASPSQEDGPIGRRSCSNLLGKDPHPEFDRSLWKWIWVID
jgi:hypothetical protein